TPPPTSSPTAPSAWRHSEPGRSSMPRFLARAAARVLAFERGQRCTRADVDRQLDAAGALHRQAEHLVARAREAALVRLPVRRPAHRDAIPPRCTDREPEPGVIQC